MNHATLKHLRISDPRLWTGIYPCRPPFSPRWGNQWREYLNFPYRKEHAN